MLLRVLQPPNNAESTPAREHLHILQAVLLSGHGRRVRAEHQQVPLSPIELRTSPIRFKCRQSDYGILWRSDHLALMRSSYGSLVEESL